MSKHEYLMQIRYLTKMINNKLKELEQLKAMSSGVSGIRYDKDKIQTSPSADAIPNMIVKIIETEQKVNELIDELVDRREEIISVIEQLTVPEEYDALHKYYVQGLNWEKVADDIGYTYDGILKLKNRALNKLSI